MESTASSPSEYHSAASVGDWPPRPRRYVSSPVLPVASAAAPLRLRSPSQSTFGPPLVLRMDHHHLHAHPSSSATTTTTPARKLVQSSASPHHADVSPESYSSPNNTASSQSYLTLSSRGSPPHGHTNGRRLYTPGDWQYQVAERLFLEGALNDASAFIGPSDHSSSASQDDDPFRSDASPDSSHVASSAQPMHHNPSKTSLGARLRSSLPLSRSRSFSRSKSNHPAATSSNSLLSSSPPSLPLPPLPSNNPPLSPFSSTHPLPLKRKQDDLNLYPPLVPPPPSPNPPNIPLPSIPRDFQNTSSNHHHISYDDDDGPVVRGRAVPSEQAAVVYSLNNSSRLSRFSLCPSLTPSETANLSSARDDENNRLSNSQNKKGNNAHLTSIQEASSSGSISTTTSERFQDSPDDDFTDHSRMVMTGPRSVKTSLVFSPCDDPNFYAVPPAKLRRVWKFRKPRPSTWSPSRYFDEDTGEFGDGEDEEDSTDVDTTNNFGDDSLDSSRYRDPSGLNSSAASAFVSRGSQRHRKVHSSPEETLNNASHNNRNSKSKYHRKANTMAGRETYLQTSPSQTFLPAVMRGPRVVYFDRRRHDDDASGSASQNSRAADSNNNNNGGNDTMRGRSVWSLTTSSDNRHSESSRHMRRRSYHQNHHRRRSTHHSNTVSSNSDEDHVSGPGSSSEASSFGFLSKSTLLCLPSSLVGPLSLIPFGAWCFVCGFIFFPLWWIGSVYPATPSSNNPPIHDPNPPRRSIIQSMFGSTYGSLVREDEGVIGTIHEKRNSDVERDGADNHHGGENRDWWADHNYNDNSATVTAGAGGADGTNGYGSSRKNVTSWPVALELPTTPISGRSPNDLPIPKSFSNWLTDDPNTRKIPPSPSPRHEQHEFPVTDNSNYHPTSRHNLNRAVHTWKIRCRFMSVFSVFILVPILVLVVVTGTKSARSSQVHD